MPWTDPVDPTSGTTITRAWAVTNVTNLLRWLRIMTGGADPASADQVIRSTSTSTTVWGQVTTNCIADGNVADVKLTNQKVNAFTPTAASIANLLGANLNGFWEVGVAPDGPVASQSWYVQNHLEFQFPSTYAWQTAMNIADQNEVYTRLVIANTAGPWRKMWHAGNDGSGSGLDADLLDGLNAGNSSGQIPISNGTVCTNLNADLLDGQSSAFYATASSVAAINSVPSGLIAAFANDAGRIAAGWTRFTNGNGRFLVGAGTTFSQTFTEGASAGSAWVHNHGVSLTATAASGGGAVQGGGTSSADPQGHTHPVAGSTADQTWIPPSFTVVWAQKP